MWLPRRPDSPRKWRNAPRKATGFARRNARDGCASERGPVFRLEVRLFRPAKRPYFRLAPSLEQDGSGFFGLLFDAYPHAGKGKRVSGCYLHGTFRNKAFLDIKRRIEEGKRDVWFPGGDPPD